MTDNRTTELLPCPFCGGEAHTYKNNMWHVACERAHNRCVTMSAFVTEAEAIAAWNTRAQTVFGMTLDEVRQMMKRDAEREWTCVNVKDEWQKTSFAHAGTSFCCSECGAHYVDVECYYAGLANKDEEPIETKFCPNCGARVKR